MIGRLNHVAIAVPDLAAAAAQYADTLGALVGPAQDEPDHGVTVVFIDLPNTKIELLHPLGANSPIQGFLDKNPSGGIHHIAATGDMHRSATGDVHRSATTGKPFAVARTGSALRAQFTDAGPILYPLHPSVLLRATAIRQRDGISGWRCIG